MSGSWAVAPVLRRRVLEPVWASYSGAQVLDATAKLEQSQYLSASELRQRQWSQFVDLLRNIYNRNAFYRARLDKVPLSPDTVRSWEDFRRIPILTKAEVRENAHRLLSEGFDPKRLMKAKTGGSTGKPIELVFTEEVSQLRNAIGRRNKRWAGWEVGEPVGAVWGNPVYPSTVKERLREWILNPSIYLDTMRITDEAVREFGREWARVGPTMLFGHAHSLFVLANMARDLGITNIRPRAIIPTSMMLPAHERAVIEQVFGTRATDIYGCEEVGLIAGECEHHDGLHMNVDQLIVEVLRPDGSDAAPGETGAVIVTDLLNLAMPFVRYRMEDMAEVALQPCSCGRAIPTLRRIIGRTADFLRRQDGSLVAGISLIENTLTLIPGVDQMQIEQTSLSTIVVRVVPAANFTAELRNRFIDYFRATFPGAAIDMQEVAAILPEANGKYRFSICRITD